MLLPQLCGQQVTSLTTSADPPAPRWLSVRLEVLGNVIILSAALLAVLSRGSIGQLEGEGEDLEEVAEVGDHIFQMLDWWGSV